MTELTGTAAEQRFLVNMAVLEALQQVIEQNRFTQETFADGILRELPPATVNSLRTADGQATAAMWLRAFKQPLSLYEEFRSAYLHQAPTPEKDLEALADATTEALDALNEALAA